MNRIWTTYDWKTGKEASATGESEIGHVASRDRLVLVDGGMVNGIQDSASAYSASALAMWASILRLDATVILIETAESLASASVNMLEFGSLHMPALRVERQRDLESGFAALRDTKAARKAIVLAPREPIDLRAVFYGDEMVPSVAIVRGPEGDGAWPMDLAYVRSIRDQCAEAGVPFIFLGWGDWCYRSQLPVGSYGEPIESAFNLVRYGAAVSGRQLDGVTHLGLPASALGPSRGCSRGW